MLRSLVGSEMCIRDRYKGYEVKTIGDSFMVAFVDADSATRFALGVQSALYDFDAWSPEVDATYIGILQEQQAKATSEADVEPLLGNVPKVWLPVDEETGQLNRIAYDSVWKGLRVRVGVHFGVGEIKRDKVSDRFDYYGTVVNTAARVEGVGHGGQVLLTDEAFQALSPNFNLINSLEVLDLGPQPLRGLDAPVSLLQLTPKYLNTRVYPPLRLDVDASLEEDDSEGGSYSDANSSMSASKLNPEQSAHDPWSPEAVAEKLTAVPWKKVSKSTAPSIFEQTSASKFKYSRASPSRASLSRSGVNSKAPYSPLGGRNYSLIGFELSQAQFGNPHLLGDAVCAENSQNPTPHTELAQRTASGPENHVVVRSIKDQHSQVFTCPNDGSMNSPKIILGSSRENSYMKTSANTDSHKMDHLESSSAHARDRLLTLYYFVAAALSTSTPQYRSSLVSHMSKKWHVQCPKSPSARLRSQLTRGGSPPSHNHTDDAYDQMFVVMKLCAKIEKTASIQQKKR
eukprot:TRINITY_DN9595_c0_g1_i1.p1 TRINITY_DN9595_c0_g1~~TRINITY_DN9595_c0_g1_i1.p1  ORF type:complete len:514 (-),score=41.30 TRINITY_DN9595_c0_g1_i1:130-1671(-)